MMSVKLFHGNEMWEIVQALKINTSGVENGSPGYLGPQIFRQNISTRFNCNKLATFGEIIIRKTIKIFATKSHILNT